MFRFETSNWFDRNADRYDPILYHFGNPTYHQHMFGLLERHRGIVVLHDFFLATSSPTWMAWAMRRARGTLPYTC